MRFANPYLLWLLGLLLPTIAYYIYRTMQGGAAIRFSSTAAAHRAPRTLRYWLRHAPFVLRVAALALIIVALARPQNVEEQSRTNAEGIDIMLAMDISSSMLARDFSPDRLTAAKEVAGEFIADRYGDRIGLAVFAGETYTQSPLTTDKGTLQTLLARLQSGIIEDGTAIGNGLATALNRLRESDAKSKVIILLTDGVNNRGEIAPLMAAGIAADMGVKVYTIGVGTRGKAPYPAVDMFGNMTFQMMDVEIDEQTLQEIASQTGGRYFRATDRQKLKEIYDEINTLEKSEVEITDLTIYHEQFVALLLLAVALLVAEVLLDKLVLKRIPAPMFRFANAEYLYLLILTPMLVAVLGVASWRRRHLLERFGNIEIIKTLIPNFSRSRLRLKAAIYLTALSLLILAAARPQLGSKLREEKAKGVEMMLVVDVSNSMLAEDFEPNRLERTKYAINRLFEGLQQERVGLVAFAGEPKVQLPITSDYRMAQAFARRLSTSLVAEQGTDVARALELAMLSYSSQSERSRVMILITDGENHEADAVEQARKAAALGIKIYTIGIGTPEGAPIEIDGEFIKDENGEMVVSKLGEQMLEEIAAVTDAAYVRATKQSIGLEEIVKSINEMEKSELTTLRYEEYNEQYQWLVAAALFLLVIEGLILPRRNPRLRRFNIFRE